MPTRIARRGPDFTRAELDKAMVWFDGTLVSASRNRMPNGDLADDDSRGRLRGWGSMLAPPAPDGWYHYHAEGTGPNVPMRRQGTRPYPISRDQKRQSEPIVGGPLPPDPTSRLPIARPYRPRVRLVPLADVGYAVGPWRLAINYVTDAGAALGAQSAVNWTTISDPVSFTITTVGQGFEFVPPDDPPDGVPLYGIFLSPPGETDFFLNGFVDVEGGVPESVILRGPFERGVRAPTENTTYLGGLQDLPAPTVTCGPFPGPHYPGDYRFRYRIGTQFGLSGPSQPSPWTHVTGRWAWVLVENSDGTTAWVWMEIYSPGQALFVEPDSYPKSTEYWILEVKFRRDQYSLETEWQTMVRGNGSREIPVGNAVPVQTADPDQTYGGYNLENADSDLEDTTGIEPPDVDLDTPTTFSAAPFGPGEKRIRTTWAVKERGSAGYRESAPSKGVSVTIPGSAGVATHTYVVRRPPGSNEIRDPRHTEPITPPNPGTPPVPSPPSDPGGPGDGGTDIDDEDGFLSDIDVWLGNWIDLSDLAGEIIEDTNEIIEDAGSLIPSINSIPHHVFRMQWKMRRRASGKAEALIEFGQDVSGTINSLRRDKIDHIVEAQDEWQTIERTVGAQGAPGIRNIWPSTTTHIRPVIRHVGSDTTYGARNFALSLKNLGYKAGLAHPAKRIVRRLWGSGGLLGRDFWEGLFGGGGAGGNPGGGGGDGGDDGGEDPIVTPPEPPDEDYPAGGYCVVLSEEAIDEEGIRPQQNTAPRLVPNENFADGIPDEFVEITSGMVSITTTNEDRAIQGLSSLRVKDSFTTQAGEGYVRRQIASDPSGVDSCSLEFRFMALGMLAPGKGAARIAEITNDAGANLCHLTLDNRRLRLYGRDGATTALALEEVGELDELDIALVVTGANTTAGTVRVYVGRNNRKRKLRATLTNVNLTNRLPQRIRLGCQGITDASATFDYLFDQIDVYEDHGWEDIPGRMIEYYGPPNTPNYEKYGPQGMKVPIEADREYVLSFFCSHEGVTRGAHPGAFSIKDKRGKVLDRIGSATGGIVGRGHMRRYSTEAFTTPDDAAYLEIENGAMGAGRVRIGGFQLDRGDEMTAFTNEHASTASCTVYWDMLPPRVRQDTLLGEQYIIRSFIDADVAALTPASTAVTLELSSAPTSGSPEAEWSPWVTNIADVPPANGLRARATLTATDTSTTAELRMIRVDFDRESPDPSRPIGSVAHAVTRADGTEFSGGVIPSDFPPIERRRRRTIDDYADNSEGFAVMGRRKISANGWSMEAYLDEAVSEILGAIEQGDGTIAVEENSIRYILRPRTVAFDTTDRALHYDVGLLDPGKRGYLIQSGTIESTIVSIE